VDRPDPYHFHHYVSLQTDAAINHGNSGGPILNNKGEVVAMATWSELKDETESIAFGIPADQIASALARVKPGKGVVRPWLGLSVREPYWARGGLTNDAGLLVTGAHAAGAGYRSGVRGDDWITKINGVSVNYLHEMRRELEKYQPGTTITITVERTKDGGDTWVPTNLQVKLGEYASATGEPLTPYEYEEGTDDLF
jgi:S1-C subfamily serine protease